MLLQEDFAETHLITKFSDFLIRVYLDNAGRENLVLWTKNVNQENPILVRVHSECITGDTLGSLHCDCGKQLTKSLQIIAKENGVLIYLRQEGRGIGLFEKIKSYQLQSAGYDTFDANVQLGHSPDQRSYGIVKKMLDDLKINRVRLLTNNPSKVSNIAKLGISVVEQVPLILNRNKCSKAYLETKKNKFQHFLSGKMQHYHYQFQADASEVIAPIIDYLKDKRYDPLLKICVGITVTSQSLINKDEISKVRSIINSCRSASDFIPVIHFSCKNPVNILKCINEIKCLWPDVNKIQINDWLALNIADLKKIYRLFQINIPFSDDNFSLIHDVQLRTFIKNNNSLIILDNSKGKGVKENQQSLMNKIDTLLDYGLNNITLCGGFGPDALDTYFSLKRYYRINFSIDAETNLKTNGKVDVEKVKIYLQQLIRFDDPKEQAISQTRKFLSLHRRTHWEKIKINDHEFSIHPEVFHAGQFASSLWFGSELCTLVNSDSFFCEVGCGSGVISCLVALSNPQLKVTATDLNPYAAENTKLNADQVGLNSRITVLTGDVLDSIKPKKIFDSIFWSLPFGFLDPGVEVKLEEIQVFDPGYRAIRKFLKTAPSYLKPNGRLLLGFSPDLGHWELLKELAKECSIHLKQIAEKIMKEDMDIKFEILEGKIAA